MNLKRKITLKFHKKIQHLNHYETQTKNIAVISETELLFKNLETQAFHFAVLNHPCGGIEQRICICCHGTQYNFDADHISNISIDQWIEE